MIHSKVQLTFFLSVSLQFRIFLEPTIECELVFLILTGNYNKRAKNDVLRNLQWPLHQTDSRNTCISISKCSTGKYDQLRFYIKMKALNLSLLIPVFKSFLIMGILNEQRSDIVIFCSKRKPGNCVRITNNLFVILDIRLRRKIVYNEIV